MTPWDTPLRSALPAAPVPPRLLPRCSPSPFLALACLPYTQPSSTEVREPAPVAPPKPKQEVPTPRKASFAQIAWSNLMENFEDVGRHIGRSLSPLPTQNNLASLLQARIQLHALNARRVLHVPLSPLQYAAAQGGTALINKPGFAAAGRQRRRRRWRPQQAAYHAGERDLNSYKQPAPLLFIYVFIVLLLYCSRQCRDAC